MFVDITKPFHESRCDEFINAIMEFVDTHLDYQPLVKRYQNRDGAEAVVIVFSCMADATLFNLMIDKNGWGDWRNV